MERFGIGQVLRVLFAQCSGGVVERDTRTLVRCLLPAKGLEVTLFVSWYPNGKVTLIQHFDLQI